MAARTLFTDQKYNDDLTVAPEQPESYRADKKIRLIDWILMAGVITTWGLTFVGIKETDHEAPPLQAAGVRFMVAALVLMPFALQPAKLAKLKLADFGRFIIMGLIQTTLMFGIIYISAPHVPGGVMAIIVNTNPFFVAILAHFFIKGEGLSRQKVWGLLLGFVGVLVLVFGGKGVGDVAFFWPLLLLGASVFWATSSVLVKAFKFQDILSVTAWQLFFGSIPLLITGFGITNDQPIHWNWNFIFWTFYTAVIASSFGWWAWYGLLKRYSASRISVFLFLVPVCGVIASIILLGESLTIGMVLGGLLVVGGIIIVNVRLGRGFNR